MGKFINTTYQDTVDNLVDMNKNLIDNPFYLFNNQKPTKVTYYNINIEKSTLDPGSELSYTNIGDKSSLRYNVINDFYIFQFPRIELNLEQGDFGQEGSPIEGESYIIPNTIHPYDGDYFEVSHIKDRNWLFRVNNVDRDTLENGNNVWKISWSLDRGGNKDIKKDVVNTYEYVISTEGTNTKAVVEDTKYQLARKTDSIATSLRSYFKDLFYSERVQTFIYKWYNDSNMVDPFSIEFIKRNNLLSDSENQYWYVKQQVILPATFAIDYDKSIFRAFELKDKCINKYRYESQANYIDDLATIFHNDYNPYFALNYKVVAPEGNTPINPAGIIPIMTDELVERIMSCHLYDGSEEDKSHMYLNIIIKWFNDICIDEEDLGYISSIDLTSTEEMYYMVLFLIYVIDSYTRSLLG